MKKLAVWFSFRRKLKQARSIWLSLLALLPDQAAQDGQYHELILALDALEGLINQRSGDEAFAAAKNLELLWGKRLKRPWWKQARSFFLSIFLALSLALFVRQMVFELYQIPSGSMRPTLEEKDRLIVEKTAYGLNVPFDNRHFCFDPSSVRRNDVLVFSGKGMDIPDVQTRLFFLFPSNKQYIKRVVGLPGDLLYFYGGNIYGMDRDGAPFFLDASNTANQPVEHIPFIDFDRKRWMAPSFGNNLSLYLLQMNTPVVQFRYFDGKLKGDVLTPREFHEPSAPKVTRYGDLWGIKNFGMARLLNAAELRRFGKELDSEAPLYLAIEHHPDVLSSNFFGDGSEPRIQLGLQLSFLPLTNALVKRLAKSLYTARFVVKDQTAYRYTENNRAQEGVPLPAPLLESGTYEIEAGRMFSVGWQGWRTPLPADHPFVLKLEAGDVALVEWLYNFGIEFNPLLTPRRLRQKGVPARYAYFFSGDLWLLGEPFLRKEEAELIDFVEAEQRRAVDEKVWGYEPFLDQPPPFVDSDTIDPHFLAQFGFLVPEERYMVLGDNHAMSADSREFGMVPENNIKGRARWIFWPFNERFGAISQPEQLRSSPISLWTWFVLFCLAIIGQSCFHCSPRFYKRKLARLVEGISKESPF